MKFKSVYVQPNAKDVDIIPDGDLFVSSPTPFSNEELTDDEDGEW